MYLQDTRGAAAMDWIMLTSGALTAALAAIFALGLSLSDTLGSSIVEDLRRVAPQGIAVSAKHPGILSAAYRETRNRGSRAERDGSFDLSDDWSAEGFTATPDALEPGLTTVEPSHN